jgi:hypothetical protein
MNTIPIIMDRLIILFEGSGKMRDNVCFLKMELVF